MLETLSHEKEVNAAASEAWKLIRGLLLAEIAAESLPDRYSKILVLEGDGGVGTLVQIFYTDGTCYTEKSVVVDESKRVKVTEGVEGGYLDRGFTYFGIRLEVIDIEKAELDKEDWCLLKATIMYEVENQKEANASFVSIQPMVSLLQLASDYLLANKR